MIWDACLFCCTEIVGGFRMGLVLMRCFVWVWVIGEIGWLGIVHLMFPCAY